MLPPEPEVLAHSGAVAYVIEDLICSLDAHTTLSGVQRVQAGIVAAALEASPRDDRFVIVNDRPEGGWTHLRLAPDSLRGILDYVGGARVDQEPLRHMIAAVRAEAVPICFGAGATVVILGSFWGNRERPDLYTRAKREGARLVLMIYDVIPLTHPQFCDRGLVNMFWRTLAEFLPMTDAVLAISRFTAGEVTRIARERAGCLIPIEPVPLAHVASDRPPAEMVWPPSLAHIRGRLYVVYVSTIEGRKNHLYVLRAWQRMIAAGVSVPELLFVGRIGWRCEELVAHLRETGHLGGLVHVVHELSDAELSAVYASALFTVFTSVVEGWGLPVGESLSQGVPCVASSTASMPEVGGDLVDYVDPLDVDDGVRVLTRMIEDDEYRASRIREIRARFVPRTWHEVEQDLRDRLLVIVQEAPILPAPVTLAAGALFFPGDLVGRERPAAGYFRSPMRIALADAFYEPESQGAWMRGRTGTISFRAEAPPGAEIVLSLAVMAAPWAIDRLLSLDIVGDGDAPARWASIRQGVTLLRIDGRLDARGICSLRLTCDDEPPVVAGEERRFNIGLCALGYSLCGDAVGRRALRERFLLAA